ncbi:sulfatase [Beutenbergia cavernae DSM 12333]|uniref:Sulfatase n=1 Tax=Beutenbergia cavernae (strain ATCC BAA-8 / DSM 12333 / CCUG 43141 / JCM 11478 / NBRC 16432 / NCIMB 13614 / HKI 0122) TaxID=471853 RepID=C5BWJ6_BEUC1|nr:sulfatase-like hydrolase/transferase [Beutenbergia cavernae]ACQ78654.1 sulfatase [Beutenbergia cavernae DSM 12333]
MRRPNVVLILSDDHGYADRGALGLDPAVRTPALDRLAADGVTCTDAYVTAPICSPSRAAIISGAYQQRWGARWFDSSRFGDERTSLAERFAELGYATGYLGKVHYGPEDVGDRACPPHHGFAETYYGLAGRQQGRLNYLRHSDDAVAEYGPEASWRMAVQPMLSGDDPEDLEGFLTAELGRRSRTFVDDHAAEPFFLMLAFNAVHNFCWQLPPDELRRRGLPARDDWHDADAQGYADWYDGAITPNLEHGREYYLAQLELMDAEIAALLDTLEERGLADDTIVVYLTDNGGSTCNYGSNAPLAGTKYTLWEGGIRVPFLVRWPGGGWAGGRTTTALVSSLDLVPTLVAAAGGAVDDVDGVDLADVLSGAGDRAHDALHWDCGFQWAVREGDLKLRYVDGASETAAGIRAVEHADPGDGLTLVDLAADVAERRDLAGDRPDDVARLLARHEVWRRDVGWADPVPR